MNLDETLLRPYMHRFFGYGHVGAPLWFVGAEEGGGATADEIARLRAWRDRGGRVLEDLNAFHADARISYGNGLQATWKPLMIATLTAFGRTVSDAALLEYQRESLGAFGGETCLIERLPLPKRSAKEWPYGEWTAIPELRTRAAYERALDAGRVMRILEFVRDSRPPFVVFYGNRRNWLTRLSAPVERHDVFGSGFIGGSRWYTTDHPTAWSNDGPARFAMIGADIARWKQRASTRHP